MAEISEKKRVWGWWWFDWASQPYHTLLVTFVFGPFFASVAAAWFLATGLDEKAADAEAQALWSLALTVSGLIIGLGAPLMGAMADSTGRRRPWILGFSVLYVAGASALWFTDPDGSNMWAMLTAFGIGFIGAEFALIFINSQLPGLVADENVGKVSGSGFAFGYIGGLVALAIMLVLFMEQPGGRTLVGLEPGLGLLDAGAREGTRIVGPFTALWFAVFMVPYALWVRDTGPAGHWSFGAAMRLLLRSVKGLSHKRSLSSYLVSSMFYRDALNGLYGFGGVYATLVLDWSIVTVGVFGIVSGLAAALFSWAGGKLDARLGPKPVIVGAILGLTGVIVVILFMSREAIFGLPLAEGSTIPDVIFFACGIVIGGMGGTLQAASRTLMVRHADLAAPTESFGLYGLSGRATSFMAPALIGLVTTWTGSARIGVSPLIGLFLLGLILLIWVKPDGEKA
ncbi:MAG: MFS transporter [Rhodobacterales bacterium CG2_30_65_12]|nr:MAG: MFS transporter [Rhodobacterales bacterium CG2_30_65_12]